MQCRTLGTLYVGRRVREGLCWLPYEPGNVIDWPEPTKIQFSGYVFTRHFLRKYENLYWLSGSLALCGY